MNLRGFVRVAAGPATLWAAALAAAQPPSGWLIHDRERPLPPVVRPAPQQLPAAAPSDAVVLFDGRDLAAWRDKDGGPARWTVRDGYLESVPGSGYLYSARGFGDVQLHVEWAAPAVPRGTGQERGNSGVFLMSKYEVQVLDSYDNATYADGQAGAVYGQHPPLVNACLPPGAWQAFDIVFRRPRFDHQGMLHAPARITVVHNGVLVQDAVAAWGPTSWLQNFPYEAHPDRLPLGLQDHGNPVRYRNIWLRELPETEPPGPTAPIVREYLSAPAAEHERVAGAYVFEDETPVRVDWDEGRLWFQPAGRPRLELIPAGAGAYALRWTAGEVVFEPASGGPPARLTMHLGGRAYPARRQAP
jgi:hypothetical protein